MSTDLQVLANAGLKFAVGQGVKAGVAASGIGSAVAGAVEGTFGLAAGALSAALSFLGPIGIAFSLMQLAKAVGSVPDYSKTLDETAVTWNGQEFVVERTKVAGDDETGKIADAVAARLNRYYAGKPYDHGAYRANDPFPAAPQDPESMAAQGGAPTVRDDIVGHVSRLIPDVRQPTIGYRIDNDWTGDAGVFVADSSAVADAMVRRALVRAGESTEAIDSFMGGAAKGAVGGLAHSQSLPRSSQEPGAAALSAEAEKLVMDDHAMRFPAFSPIDDYRSYAAGLEEVAATPDAGSDPVKAPWSNPWMRDRPVAKPGNIANATWESWATMTQEQQAGAWRDMPVTDWRTLTGLAARPEA